MGSLLSMLGGFINPILNILGNLFSKTIFPFIIKHWKIVIPMVIVLSMFGYMYYLLLEKDKEILNWRNETAKAKKLEQVAKNTYEKQAIELTKININNKELAKLLKDSKRETSVYTEMAFSWKARFDSIKTLPPTVIYVNTNDGPTDTTDRTFNFIVPNELILAGWFQTKSPWQLFIQNLELKMRIDASVNFNKDGTYFIDVNTNSKYLKPSQIDIQVVPFPVKWEYFYGGTIMFQDLLNVQGIGATAGVKSGYYGGYVGINYINSLNKNSIYYNIGILKFGIF